MSSVRFRHAAPHWVRPWFYRPSKRRCLGCGRPLPKRSQEVYCSLKCQRSLERVRKTATWRKSGQAIVEGYKGHYIRLHILDEQDGCCAICGIADLWNDLPLVLVLDHIDGGATNNQRANLRMICPNCDSQRRTFKSRNRGNGRHFPRERCANGQSY